MNCGHIISWFCNIVDMICGSPHPRWRNMLTMCSWQIKSAMWVRLVWPSPFRFIEHTNGLGRITNAYGFPLGGTVKRFHQTGCEPWPRATHWFRINTRPFLLPVSPSLTCWFILKYIIFSNRMACSGFIRWDVSMRGVGLAASWARIEPQERLDLTESDPTHRSNVFLVMLFRNARNQILFGEKPTRDIWYTYLFVHLFYWRLHRPSRTVGHRPFAREKT